MQRAFVLLLLLLLPMQIVLAGVDSYWPQEKAAGAQHPGHHVHDYSQAQANPGLAADDTMVGEDPDCDYCHHGFCNIISVNYHFGCSPGRLDPPANRAARYQSFIGDIAHPPDI
jgi:hypothetical protein